MILEFWQGAGDPVRGLAVVVRAVATIGALGAAGSALFLVFLSERLTVDEARAARRWTAVFVMLALVGGIALWPFRAIELSGAREGMARWQLYGQIARSGFGEAWLIVGAGLVLVLFSRVRATWGAGIGSAGALLVAIGLALSGHGEGHRMRQEVLALGVVHVFAAAFWFGSLLPLRNVAVRRDPRSAAEAVLAWSRYAMVFAVLAVAGGVVLGLLLAGGPIGWIRSGYGWAMIIKAAFVVAMVLGALACRFKHVRLMERGDVLAGDALHRSAGRQFLFALLVLYATAELASAELPVLATR